MARFGTVICAIAKNEHRYLNDWCKHHLSIGFDHIFVFDNDDLDVKESAASTIDPSIRNKVHFIDIRGKHRDFLQNSCYNRFYQAYKDQFEWCAFLDVDEFIFGTLNIKDCLRQIPWEFDGVRIKWKLFGDGNLIERNMSIPIYEALKVPATKPFNLLNQGKTIVRGGVKDLIISSVHFASIKTRSNIIKACLPSGKPCKSEIIIYEDYSKEKIYINHYMTKTLSEFIDQKFGRGDCVFGDRNITFGYFFQLNEKTPEKIAYLKKRGFSDKVIHEAIDNHRLNANLKTKGDLYAQMINKQDRKDNKEAEALSQDSPLPNLNDLIKK